MVKVKSQEGKHEDIKTDKGMQDLEYSNTAGQLTGQYIDQPSAAKHQTGNVRDGSVTGHHFSNVSSGKKSRLHNGDINEDGSKALSHRYDTIVATGNSFQHNGNKNGSRDR